MSSQIGLTPLSTSFYLEVKAKVGSFIHIGSIMLQVASVVSVGQTGAAVLYCYNKNSV